MLLPAKTLALVAALRAAWAERDELRAILAPLLDDPYRLADPVVCCCFCGARIAPEWFEQRHEPDCSVLDRDRLLGR